MFVWLGSFEESLSSGEGGDSGISSPFAISFGVQILCMLLFPLTGAIADRVGLLPVMITASVALILTAIPAFYLVNTGETANAVLAQVWLAFVLAGIGAPLPAWFISRFPPTVRYTGVAIGYNFAQAIFGGTAAIIATLLADVDFPGMLAGTGPGMYLAFIGLLAMIAQLVGAYCMRSH